MNRRIGTLLALFLVAGLGACAESLDSGAACPSLCPAQKVPIYDTLISPVLAFDSTIVGYPERGNENGMLLATRGDTVEVRGIVRFDSLVTYYTPVNDTSHTIVRVDSSRLRIVLDTTRATLPASVRFELYDVDDTLALDTAAAPVLAKFTPARRIGGATFDKALVHDTLFLPIADSVVLNKLATKSRLRVGIRVDGSGPVNLRAYTVESGIPAVLTYRGTQDTTIAKLSISPASATPVGQDDIKRDLKDYQLVAKYNMPSSSGAWMAVGGVPGRRAYLRFNIPRHLTDSTTVIRATLRLTQQPTRFGSAHDTIVLHAQVGLASPQITDLRRAASIIGAPGILISDSLLTFPSDSGVKSFELYNLVRAWGAQVNATNPPPRTVVLRASAESTFPSEIRFFSTTSSVALRPVMRISYIPNVSYGVP